MKRTETLAAIPTLLENFIRENEGEDRWEILRDNNRPAYLELRAALRLRQRGLCAFCEILLLNGDQQIEHWIPKSMSSAVRNWTFDISNLHLSCESISKRHWFPNDPLRGADPEPRPNEHCGQAKKDNSPTNLINGALPIRPTEIPLQPAIFKIESSGAIYASAAECYSTRMGVDRATATISFMNLDCTRLRHLREAIWTNLDAAFIQIVEEGKSDEEALDELCDITVLLDENGDLPEFITTLRSYFGKYAENRLNLIQDWAVRP